jgi:hypothetical protein
MKKADKERYDLLIQLGCIVCLIHKGIYTPPQIHHPYGRKGDGNQKTIGLCYCHHMADQENPLNPEYTSRHPYKKRFEARYGTEAELLEETNRRLEKL